MKSVSCQKTVIKENAWVDGKSVYNGLERIKSDLFTLTRALYLGKQEYVDKKIVDISNEVVAIQSFILDKEINNEKD